MTKKLPNATKQNKTKRNSREARSSDEADRLHGSSFTKLALQYRTQKSLLPSTEVRLSPCATLRYGIHRPPPSLAQS